MTNALIEGNAAATTALFASIILSKYFVNLLKSLVGGIVATSNKYIEQVFRLSQSYPRELTGGFVMGFCYIISLLDCHFLIIL